MPRWNKKDRRKPPSAAAPARPETADDGARPGKEPAGRFRERRRDSRLIEENKVSIELLADGRSAAERTITNALTKDISPGGVRVVTSTLLPVDTLLMMEIVLSGLHRVLRAMGVVRWTRSVYGEGMFESGIEFTQISPEEKLLLLEHTYKKKG
jgi:hypothetical protein